MSPNTPLLDTVKSPADTRALSLPELRQLADELRAETIDAVSVTGGHLGSSLGATEIIAALHYVYQTPQDKLIFDTGHQSYSHKLLTGRREKFAGIRQLGGISGFPKRSESEYDVFGTGHASTAISAALGVAAARDVKGEDFKVVALVADGCMTGGEAYEGLQNAGMLQSDLLVILNDNQMFISKRVGALGTFLTKLLTLGAVRGAEDSVKKFLERFRFWGSSILRLAKRARVLLFPGMLFEEMGFAYFGPVDGHDVVRLVEVLRHIKTLRGPVLLHCITKKGKGYPYAENEATAFHGPSRFDLSTGQFLKNPTPKDPPPSYTSVFSKAVVKEAQRDPRIVAITAAMPEGTGLDRFRDEFPRRYFDVGIAEEHAVTFAGGLAAEGLRPVLALYSSFLQRGFDQVAHDVCLQNLPVTFAIDRGGLVGEDGPTHHGVFDLGFMRMLPKLTVLAAADENELQHMLRTALTLDGPAALRYPRGLGVGVAMDPEAAPLPIGKGVRLKEGSAVTLLAIGNRVHPCLQAAQRLDDKGVSAGVINMRFVKPLDEELVRQAAAATPYLVTVEDNAVPGGFGSAVLEALGGAGGEVLRLGIPDRWVEHGSLDQLYDLVGISSQKIAQSVCEWLERRPQPARAGR